MKINKKFLNYRVALITLLIILFAAYGGVLFFRNTRTKIIAAPGVPMLSYAIVPTSVQGGQNFDLVLKVNPNGASFNAFELYTNYDATRSDFQDTTNLANNISSPHILINSSVNQGSNIITIIGVKTGSPITGTVDQEIARVRMKVITGATGDMFFIWDSNTALGDKIARDTVDGIFPIIEIIPTPTITPIPTKSPVPTRTPTPFIFPTSTPWPTFPPPPTDTPIPTPTVTSEINLLFKVQLPDIISPNVSASDVQIELRDGSNTIGIANMNLFQNGNYFETGSPVTFTIPQDNYYDIYIKTRISLGRLFTNVLLYRGQTLDCIAGNVNCGDLFSQIDSKPLFSGDSDGFDTASGSYNKVDSADLAVLTLYFNQFVSGPEAAADYNLDGQVEISDLEIIGKNYGQVGD